MSASSDTQMSSISKATTYEEIGAYWDDHSLADIWDQTREAQFEVRADRRRRVALDPDIYTRIEAHARARGLSPETLVNVWLVERLQSTGHPDAQPV